MDKILLLITFSRRHKRRYVECCCVNGTCFVWCSRQQEMLNAKGHWSRRKQKPTSRKRGDVICLSLLTGFSSLMNPLVLCTLAYSRGPDLGVYLSSTQTAAVHKDKIILLANHDPFKNITISIVQPSITCHESSPLMTIQYSIKSPSAHQ